MARFGAAFSLFVAAMTALTPILGGDYRRRPATAELHIAWPTPIPAYLRRLRLVASSMPSASPRAAVGAMRWHTGIGASRGDYRFVRWSLPLV